eukprot:TRINITY_DN7374_c0_g1_i1.p1 TRINITY_DN7374_c0_g1~~TRINITY_DN7374_c0_g1_i1.p1  ORF type:complete len:832 (+),score=117.96 TRINITY_DN7374_c0_g1_i1:40-2535(+)
MPIVRVSGTSRPWPEEPKPKKSCFRPVSDECGVRSAREGSDFVPVNKGVVKEVREVKIVKSKEVPQSKKQTLCGVRGKTFCSKKAPPNEILRIVEVPVPVEIPVHIEVPVEVPVPVEIPVHIQVPVEVPVHVEVPVPFEVHVPSEAPVHTPLPTSPVPRDNVILYSHSPPPIVSCASPSQVKAVSSPLFYQESAFAVPNRSSPKTPRDAKPLFAKSHHSISPAKQRPPLFTTSDNLAIPRQTTSPPVSPRPHLSASSNYVATPRRSEALIEQSCPSLCVFPDPVPARPTSPKRVHLFSQSNSLAVSPTNQKAAVAREPLMLFTKSDEMVLKKQREVLYPKVDSITVPRAREIRKEVVLSSHSNSLVSPRAKEARTVPSMPSVPREEKREVMLYGDGCSLSVPRERERGEVVLYSTGSVLRRREETSREVVLYDNSNVLSVPRNREVRQEVVLYSENRKLQVRKEKCNLVARSEELSVPRERKQPIKLYEQMEHSPARRRLEVQLYGHSEEMSIEREKPTRSNTPVEVFSTVSSVARASPTPVRQLEYNDYLLGVETEFKTVPESSRVPDTPPHVSKAISSAEERVYIPPKMTGLWLHGVRDDTFRDRLRPYLVPRPNPFINVRGREEEVLDMCCSTDGIEEDLVAAAMEVIGEVREMQGVCILKAKAGMMRGLGLDMSIQDPPMFADEETAAVLSSLWQLDYPPGQAELFKKTLRDIIQLLLPYLRQEAHSGRYISPPRGYRRDADVRILATDHKKISPPRSRHQSQLQLQQAQSSTPSSLLRFPSPVKSKTPITPSTAAPHDYKYISPLHNRHSSRASRTQTSRTSFPSY